MCYNIGIVIIYSREWVTMKSLSAKITLLIVVAVFAATGILGSVAIVSSYTATMKTADENITEMAKLASQSAYHELTTYRNVAIEAGTNTILTSKDSSNERKQIYLDMTSKLFGYQRGNLIDSDGNGLDGKNYSDRMYFQEAMKGNACTSEPLISKITGKTTIIVAAPLWQNGQSGGTPIGCVYFVPNEEFLNNVVRGLNISKNSSAYIIDGEGNTIAHIDSEMVFENDNVTIKAQTDKNYEELAAIHAKMRAGEEGFSIYHIDGQKKLAGYAPIEGTNGWSICVYAPESDFTANVISGIIISVVVLAAALLISIITAVIVGRRIGGDVRKCSDRMAQLSEGDLTSPVPQMKRRDEVGILCEKSTVTVNAINAMIKDIDRILSEMANGNFDVHADNEAIYKGDFHSLIESLKKINHKLNGTLSRINVAADQVSAGADQVSAGAQALSQGATEQASSIQQLDATIRTVADKIVSNSDDCRKGKDVVDETISYISDAADEMNKLTDAMGDIDEASREINRIIGTIEDIAFQTNILALNAAVEAARAGAAGKGFAVVADEVRNLASKSAEAAHSTTQLIEKAVAAVENGNAITAQTAAAVENVETRAKKVSEIVAHIADASEEQKDMVEQIKVGMDQISSVVQTNSATAEESAAASEELSGQSNMLKELIGSFTLRSDITDDDDDNDTSEDEKSKDIENGADMNDISEINLDD